MSDTSIKIKDADGVVHPVDTRKLTDGDERQVFLLGDVENPGIIDLAAFIATNHADLAALLAKLGSVTLDSATLTALETITVANPTDVSALATSAKQDAAKTVLDAINAALAHGTYAYAAGTAATTVDVPTGARVKRVSVIAGTGGTATVTIAGGSTITIPAGGSFDEQIPGDAATGADVVIGGTVSSYYVGWVA